MQLGKQQSSHACINVHPSAPANRQKHTVNLIPNSVDSFFSVSFFSCSTRQHASYTVARKREPSVSRKQVSNFFWGGGGWRGGKDPNWLPSGLEVKPSPTNTTVNAVLSILSPPQPQVSFSFFFLLLLLLLSLLTWRHSVFFDITLGGTYSHHPTLPSDTGKGE